jgi:F-type H+-transporting ATPase subunit delta
MKVAPAQYAKSLYESTVGKGQAEIDEAVLNFAKILEKNNNLKLKNNIIAKFQEIFNAENGIVVAEVTSSEALDRDMLEKVEAFVKDKYNSKEVIIQEKVDQAVMGGIVVKVGDEVFDASVKKQLINLKKQLAH